MKYVRLGSLFVSYIYIFSYLFWLVSLLVILDDLDENPVTWVGMFSCMTISYNLLLEAPVLPINIGIALKEASMELIQFANDVAGTGLDDWSLGFHNIVDMMVSMVNWFNPLFWMDEDEDKWETMYE